MHYIKAFFRNFGVLLSYLLPYQVFSFAKALATNIFSGYIKKQFKAIGKNFFINYPLDLIGGEFISIGDNFHCSPRLRLEAHKKHLNEVYYPRISIGNNVAINFDCHIACVNLIEIGNNVLIASKVFITDHFHGEITQDSLQVAPTQRKVISKGPVIIEDNVWIGEAVAILPNVIIGKNSIIGANSVVTRSFPPNSVIAGVPAKLIKTI